LASVGTALMSAEEGLGAGSALLERSLAMSLELDLEDHVGRGYGNLSTLATRQRRFDDARRLLGAGIAYMTDHDMDSYRLYLMGWLAMCDMWQGRYDEAARLASELLGPTKRYALGRIQPLIVLGRVRSRRGEPDGGPLLDEALALAS